MEEWIKSLDQDMARMGIGRMNIAGMLIPNIKINLIRDQKQSKNQGKGISFFSVMVMWFPSSILMP